MPDKQLILIVDDEEDVRDLVGQILRGAGYHTKEAADGLAALRLAHECKPDAMVLDVMMPGCDGLSVCEQLRNDEGFRHMPIIMLTARGLPEERIAGLEKGADDYIGKPFSPRELVLRVRAALRLAACPSDGTELDIGPFHFDMLEVRASIDGVLLELTLLEFKLLHLLASHKDVVLEREATLRKIWGHADTERSRTLDTHMKRLRKKIGSNAGWIQTVHGSGYIFQEPAPTRHVNANSFINNPL